MPLPVELTYSTRFQAHRKASFRLQRRCNVFIPSCFTHPDILRTIEVASLLDLLRPHEKYLESRGFAFPGPAPAKPDCSKLALILVNSDGDTPPDLLESLHVIGNVGVQERVDQLLDIARLHGVKTSDRISAIDLAIRVWFKAPAELVKLERDEFLQKAFKFEYFPTTGAVLGEIKPEKKSDFSNLEKRLDDWFLEHKRGIGSVVQCADSGTELRFLVDHGLTCKRDRDRKGRQSSPLYFRPEKMDLVVLDLVEHELRVHASTVGEVRLYVMEFGRHLFNDPGYFAFKKKYTLEPLRTRGRKALVCKGIEGMKSVRLRELTWTWDNAFAHVVKHRASDLFLALGLQRLGIPLDAILTKAVFEVELTDVEKSRRFSIWPPKTAAYGRGEEAALIEQWLRKQDFILLGKKMTREKADPLVAST
jgi:hypothetical protein